MTDPAATRGRAAWPVRLAAPLATVRARLQRREVLPILLLGVAAAAGWAFVGLAGEVMEGDTGALDRRLLLALRAPGDPANPLGPSWLAEAARDVTALGGTTVLVLVVLAAASFLLLSRRGAEACILLAASVGATILELSLKGWFARARPDLVPHAVPVFDASFPSGHATLSAAVFLTAGALLARAAPEPRLKIHVATVAAVLAVLVGVSRVYLGVHWPSDVLAGWVLGAGWAALCWAVALRFGRPSA